MPKILEFPSIANLILITAIEENFNKRPSYMNREQLILTLFFNLCGILITVESYFFTPV